MPQVSPGLSPAKESFLHITSPFWKGLRQTRFHFQIMQPTNGLKIQASSSPPISVSFKLAITVLVTRLRHWDKLKMYAGCVTELGKLTGDPPIGKHLTYYRVLSKGVVRNYVPRTLCLRNHVPCTLKTRYPYSHNHVLCTASLKLCTQCLRYHVHSSKIWQKKWNNPNNV